MTETVHEDRVGELQTYELGYHLVPSLSEDDLALRVDELIKLVTAGDGTLIAEGSPQSFVLSYTMRKQRGGRWDKYDSSYFGWARFSTSPEHMTEIRDALEHNEHVIRYLLIKVNQKEIDAAAAARRQEVRDVNVSGKTLVRKQEEEEKGEVSEEELDKQIKELIS